MSPFFEPGDKFGYVDYNGAFVIEPQYHHAEDFSTHGIAPVYTLDPESDEKTSFFINKKGQRINSEEFEGILGFKEGFALVKKHRWGFADESGTLILDPTTTSYMHMSYFVGGFAVVQDVDSRLWGFIDSTGKVVLEPQYYEEIAFFPGLALVRKELKSKPMFINMEGNPALEMNFSYQGKAIDPSHLFFYKLSEGLISVEYTKKKLMGYMDLSGKMRIDFQFELAGDFKNGVAAVKRPGEERSYINQQGEAVPAPLGDFSEGFAAKKEGDLFGYINMKGEILIEPQFKYAGDFSEGRALVKKDGKFGLIDQKGAFVVPPQFGRNELFPFKNGLARACISNDQ